MSTTVQTATPKTSGGPPSFKADLIYGASGTTKTSQIGKAALWYFERTGKRTRLITADPGGYEPIASLVDEGIVDVWVLSQEEFFIEACQHACAGRWPRQVTPDVKNPKGRVLSVTTPEEWAGIALVAVEGLTSIGDGIIKRLRDTRAKLSQDPSYVWSDGAASFAGGNMTYYGFAQDQIRDLVTASSMLTCDKVIWTALEGRGEEEGTKAPTFGPSIAGKKSIGKAGQWFGNMVHMEMLTTAGTKNTSGQQALESKVVMYLRNHADAQTQIPFPAKTRMPFQFATPGMVDPETKQAYMPEFMEPDLGKLYERLESLRLKAREGLKK